MKKLFLLVQISDTMIFLKGMDEQSLNVDLMCRRSLDLLKTQSNLENFIIGFSQKIRQCEYEVSTCFLLNQGNHVFSFIQRLLTQSFRPTHLFEIEKEDINLQEIGDFQIPEHLKEDEELWDIGAKLSALGILNITKSEPEFIGALSLDFREQLWLTALKDNRLFHGRGHYLPHDFPRCVPMPDPIRSMIGAIVLQANIFAHEILEAHKQEMELSGLPFNAEEAQVPLFLTGNINNFYSQYVRESLERTDKKIHYFGFAPDLMFDGLVYALDNHMLQHSDPVPAPSGPPVPPAA